MTKDDPRFEQWSNRKPSPAAREAAREVGAATVPAAPESGIRGAASRVVQDVGKSLSSSAQQVAVAKAREYAPRVASWIGANAAKLAKYSLVGLAGVAAYELTSKLRTLRHKTYPDLLYDLANEYRHARQTAAAGASRALTTDELAQFTAWYKAKRAEIEAARDAGRSITGLSNLIFGD